MLSREQKIDNLFSIGALNGKKVVKTVFGGVDDSAQRRQINENAQAKALIAENTAAVREDILRLFPAAEQAQQLGFQGALDVLGQTIPQQLGTFQQGNIGAQQNLLGGLQQQQNAILGLPTDFSGFQPQQVSFDPSFAQQQLPQFQTSQQALNPPVSAPIGSPLGGNNFSGGFANIQRALARLNLI